MINRESADERWSAALAVDGSRNRMLRCACAGDRAGGAAVHRRGGCDVGYQPGSGSGSGSWLATAYGPPRGGIQGDGITATGINLTTGRAMLEVAVDPHVIALRSFVHVAPNPFWHVGAFYAGDTGGAIFGRHVDIYDWQGRAAQDAWGARGSRCRPGSRSRRSPVASRQAGRRAGG
jgi:3D (Asp-Asp-Asp) domain-containing protein